MYLWSNILKQGMALSFYWLQNLQVVLCFSTEILRHGCMLASGSDIKAHAIEAPLPFFLKRWIIRRHNYYED